MPRSASTSFRARQAAAAITDTPAPLFTLGRRKQRRTLSLSDRFRNYSSFIARLSAEAPKSRLVRGVEMVHDPCNPLPNFVIPGGLVPRHRHMAVPQAGHANTALQSHAITSITTTYLGCDHNDHKSTRIKSVQFPPVVNLPAANVPRTSAIAVATLPSFTLPISSFAGIPEGAPPELPMPEPASAAMFLFAVFITWAARRVDCPRLAWRRTWPSRVSPVVPTVPAARHRHRSRSIACYSAYHMQTP
jgi:hypothetical protein